MSVCVSVNPICATNKELNLISWLVSFLSVYENYYLSASFACELVSSLSAYEISLVYLEKISIPR